ncbi:MULTISPECIES: hypothetical protein [unclassified Pseudoalteromonas]|uniref:hypothetical protein n=1 Tax=unclassified Pseudoalteromonas TaxID=194690 RepID=UPI00386BAEA2
MANETKKTLWTSVYSDRSGIESVDTPPKLSQDDIEKIRSAFVKKTTSNRAKTYSVNSSSEDLSLARVFG